MKKKKTQLLNTKEDALEFIFFVATLMAEALPKGKHRLHIKQGEYEGYCCLGTGVSCTVPEHELNKDENDKIKGYGINDQHGTPLWLKNLNINYMARRPRHESLIYLNDNTNLTHAEIGEILLKEYQDELNLLLS